MIFVRSQDKRKGQSSFSKEGNRFEDRINKKYFDLILIYHPINLNKTNTITYLNRFFVTDNQTNEHLKHICVIKICQSDRTELVNRIDHFFTGKCSQVESLIQILVLSSLGKG